MKKAGYYSSGEFAQMAHVTVRTIRYYDKQNVLKPSLITDSGVRFYTEEDFARLQQIILLKYLGFSLEDIREMLIVESDYLQMLNSLDIQLKLVQDRIEQMQLVEDAIRNASNEIRLEKSIDWNRMLKLIHLTSIETSLKNQYQNASNISARINLHRLCSKNHQDWFSWVYDKCNIYAGIKILELGCGDGTLWKNNLDKLPSNVKVVLSDISEGMLRDARRKIGSEDKRFEFKTFDCHKIPFEDNEFQLVIGNHVMFYCKDILQVGKEVRRVLKEKGSFVCSTYGSKHMQEISQLVQEFDEKIVLSGEKLYEKFGRENGKAILTTYFSEVFWSTYEDYLQVWNSEPLVSYILSCHGNQGQYISKRYPEFRSYVKKKIKNGFFISKDAGLFICKVL